MTPLDGLALYENAPILRGSFMSFAAILPYVVRETSKLRTATLLPPVLLLALELASTVVATSR